VLCYTQRRWRWSWRPPGQDGVSTRPMVAYSGFAWSHQYAPSGDMPRSVSPRRHGCHNRHRFHYIVYNRVADKWINSLTVNGFSYIASTTSPPDPFGRGYTRPIGCIHRSHAIWGANGTTMVVMFVIVVFVVNSTFRTIPTVESYGAGVFVPARTDLP
jgi:hypothetical protein